MDTKPTPTPVMDVVTAPPAERRDPPSRAAESPKPDPKPDPKPKAPREPATGVGMAIFATMVIVLVLASLATYAYLQSH